MIDDTAGEGTLSGMPGPVASAHACERKSGAERAAGARDAAVARRRKRAIVLVAAVVLVGAAAAACLQWLPGALAWLADAQAVRAFVNEHAVLSRVVLVGINVLQVILAFLPGEPVELASGYAFGFWEGTALCLVASAVARSLVYVAVRRWGWRVVGLFFDRALTERFAWLRNTRRVELTMFIVFLIPGTPKDFLTYFAGLAGVSYPALLLIATAGTLPSVITSTAAASAFGSGDYGLAAIVVAVAALLLAAGAVGYRVYRRHCTGGVRDA